jgi:hypothetical protein
LIACGQTLHFSDCRSDEFGLDVTPSFDQQTGAFSAFGS